MLREDLRWDGACVCIDLIDLERADIELCHGHENEERMGQAQPKVQGIN